MNSSLYESYKVMQSNEGQAVTMTSLEVVDLINKFRVEELSPIVKKHKDFMKSIRVELESVEKAGEEIDGRKISLVEYVDAKGEKRPCYKMNKFWIMQMLNKESALVRYKTQQYIEALENKLKQQTKPLSTMELLELEFEAIKEQGQKIDEVKHELDDYKDNAPLFQVDCKEIQAEVKRKGTKVLGGYRSPAYLDNSLRGKVYEDIQRELKRQFGVNRYEAIKRKDYEKALIIISDYEAPFKLQGDIELKNSQIGLELEKVGVTNE